MSEVPWRTVLLTGATGLIGRAIHKELIESGVSVIVPNNRSAQVNRGRTDLSKSNVGIRALTAFCPDAIIHAAAWVPHNPSDDTEMNAERTRQIDRNIHDVQRRLNIPCIYLSGCSLYQSQGAGRCDESAELKQPTELTPYLCAKRDGEILFRSAGNAIIFRLSSPIGPGLNRSTVVFRFVQAARTGNTLHVWGSGTREQDFIDVRDVARIVGLCTRHRRFGIYNVARGVPITMRELAETVVSVFGQGRMTVGEREDPEEGKTARYNPSSGMQVFGWEPRHSLQDSVRLLRELGTAAATVHPFP